MKTTTLRNKEALKFGPIVSKSTTTTTTTKEKDSGKANGRGRRTITRWTNVK